MAEPGGIYVSGSAYDHLRRKLALGYEYLDEQTVKNILDPVRIYRVCADDGIAAAHKQPKKPSRLSRGLLLAIVSAACLPAALVIGALLFLPQSPFHSYIKRHGETAVPVSDRKSASQLAQSAPVKTPDALSIAVLPFKNIGGDTKGADLGAGLTLEVIDRLSSVPSLLVIAPETVFSLKEGYTEPDAIRRKYNVRFMATGEIRRSGGVMESTIMIFDTNDGGKVGEDRFNRTAGGPALWPQEIVHTIMSAMNIRPVGMNSKSADKSSTYNPTHM